MPFKTQYGSHYHMTLGCHGATIPCDTAGLEPCSDCCGQAGGGAPSGQGASDAIIGGGIDPHDDPTQLAYYEGAYNPSMPVARITEAAKATVVEHTNGVMEAFVNSSFIDSISFIPGEDGAKDTIIMSFREGYVTFHRMQHSYYSYTGGDVSRELYERIVSSDSIGAMANGLIHDPDVTSTFIRTGDTTEKAPLPRGILATARGAEGFAGTDAPAGSITVSGVISTDDDLLDIEENVSEIRDGKPAPQPVIVTMQQPDDEDIRRRLDVFNLHPTVDRRGFSDGLEKSRHMNKFGCFVDGKSPEELSDAKLFVSPDGLTGCAVLADGDIVGVFNANPEKKGAAKPLLELAKQNGGTKMDCYGEKLVHIYESCGYEAVARIPFNADYVDDTPFNKELLAHQPTVYVLKLREDPNDRHPTTQDELDALPMFDDPENGYGDALSYRDGLLAEQQMRQSE